MRKLIGRTLGCLFCLLLCLGGVESCDGLEADRSDPFTSAGLLRADAGALRATLVSPDLEAPIHDGKNVLWCGTFQLAWNQVSDLAGGKLQFRPPFPDAVDILNRRSFTAADLDAPSYLVLAGYIRDGILDRIPRELNAKFGSQARPSLLPHPAGGRPQDIVAYAYLFKNLQFPVPYEAGEAPASFAGRPVECFGMGTDFKPGRERIAAQTLIHDYLSPDDFVIELKTKLAGDRLILAKVQSATTLGQTAAAVQRRAALAPSVAEPADVLVVPKLNFDITRDYRELCGLSLVPTTPGMADDLSLLVAEQNIRFQMDEKGVRLRSEAHMSFGCSAEYRPEPKHLLVFDKPFLLMLMREGASQPYFALWVANPELLVRGK